MSFNETIGILLTFQPHLHGNFHFSKLVLCTFQIGKCLELCQTIDIECKGYTWYGEEPSSGVKDICVLFRELNREGPCFDCTSGKAQVIADGL